MTFYLFFLNKSKKFFLFKVFSSSFSIALIYPNFSNNDKEDVSSSILPLLEKSGYIKAIEKEEEKTLNKKNFLDLFKKNK